LSKKTLPRTGNKRDFNGLVKLGLPTVQGAQSPPGGRETALPPDASLDSSLSGPQRMHENPLAAQLRGQPPRQALFPMNFTGVRLNSPQKERQPPPINQAVHIAAEKENEDENEYTKLHVDPNDPTRIKRRRRIPP